jgi:hypothetical protein
MHLHDALRSGAQRSPPHVHDAPQPQEATGT